MLRSNKPVIFEGSATNFTMIRSMSKDGITQHLCLSALRSPTAACYNICPPFPSIGS